MEDLTYKLGEFKTDSARLGNDVRRIRRVVDLLQLAVQNSSSNDTKDASVNDIKDAPANDIGVGFVALGDGKDGQNDLTVAHNLGKRVGETVGSRAKYGKNYRKGLKYHNSGHVNEIKDSLNIPENRAVSYLDYDKNDLDFSYQNEGRKIRKNKGGRKSNGSQNIDKGVSIGGLDRRPFADKVDVGSVDQNDLIEGLQDIKDVDKIDYGRYDTAGVRGLVNRDITDDEESLGKSLSPIAKLGRVGRNRNVL